MPYASDKQRRFMHARHPGIARRWDAEEKERRVSKIATFGEQAKIGRKQTTDNEVSKVMAYRGRLIGSVRAAGMPRSFGGQSLMALTLPKAFASMAGESAGRARFVAARTAPRNHAETKLKPVYARGRASNKIVAGAAAGGAVGGGGLVHLGHRSSRRDNNAVVKRERIYDAHDARQRRLGAMTAASSAGALALGGLGARGVLRSTRNVRSLVNDAKALRGQKLRNDKGQYSGLGGRAREAVSYLHNRPTTAASPRDLAALSGASLLAGTASELSRHGRSESNRRWQ